MSESDVLPDALAPNLNIVFCGSAVGTHSARVGAYYAHPQNKFWSILFETGLTSEQLAPHRFRELPSLRIGLTDLVKSQSGNDSQIPFRLTREEARVRLRRTVEQYRPRLLAFTSKKTGQEFLGGMRAYGPQTDCIGTTRLWILPSTSGAACGSWDARIWHQLANEIRRR